MVRRAGTAGGKKAAARASGTSSLQRRKLGPRGSLAAAARACIGQTPLLQQGIGTGQWSRTGIANAAAMPAPAWSAARTSSVTATTRSRAGGEAFTAPS